MKRSRLFIAVGVVLLAVAYILPLWRIELEAPQYPEPIGMLIYISSLRGIGEHDLENINILNHYIGMKPIEPDSIPELRYMPLILGGLIVLGAVAFIVPKRWTIGVWVGAIVVVGALGLYDFDQWERDYGTHLNPNAPIKIEGMTYKPPLIGTEQLLNITAHSYPSWGGYGIVLAIVAGVAAWLCAGTTQDKRSACSNDGSLSTVRHGKSIPIATALLVMTVGQLSCSPSPEPIRYGTDECALCKMIISDQRFGAEIVTSTGKAYKFDSIECLVNYLRSGHLDTNAVALVLVTDYTSPGRFLDAHNAAYLRSEQLPSPMGADLSAYGSRDAAATAQRMHGGSVLSWGEVQQYIATLD